MKQLTRRQWRLLDLFISVPFWVLFMTNLSWQMILAVFVFSMWNYYDGLHRLGRPE
jgi:hypothetical protein